MARGGGGGGAAEGPVAILWCGDRDPWRQRFIYADRDRLARCLAVSVGGRDPDRVGPGRVLGVVDGGAGADRGAVLCPNDRGVGQSAVDGIADVRRVGDGGARLQARRIGGSGELERGGAR